MRKSLTSYDIFYKSKKICSNLFDSTQILSCSNICIYMSSFNDPDTSFIYKKLSDCEKSVFAPALRNDSIVPELLDGSELSVGKYNIKEPGSGIFSTPDNMDFIIVPGIAFDKSKSRIGFGGGYYDKFLEDFSGIKAAVCYDFQLLDTIPSCPHDIKMDIIITDKRVLF